jgi:hypothetical protein
MMENKISMDERKIWILQKCYFNYHILNVTAVINRKVQCYFRITHLEPTPLQS